MANAHGYGGSGRGGSDGGNTVDYSRSGSVSVTSGSAGSSCTIYRPASLGTGHPVILWGNGTGASPRSYAGLLRHWASWGFVVLAANTSSAGSGRDMLACLDWLERSNIRQNVDFTKVGTSGHSQGGGGSIMAGTDRRITASAPIQGYTLGLGHSRTSWTRQSGPMLLLSGSADTLVNPRTNHASLFSQANVPVFWAILQGASHFVPTGDGGGYRAITTAWFMYQLKGDTHARSQFSGSSCGYCSDRSWTVQRKGI